MGGGALRDWLEDRSDPGGALKGRFPIDECLSPALVATAKARNFEADHVTYLGKAGWQDWNLVPFAVANDYVIVTNNRRDFLKE